MAITLAVCDTAQEACEFLHGMRTPTHAPTREVAKSTPKNEKHTEKEAHTYTSARRHLQRAGTIGKGKYGALTEKEKLQVKELVGTPTEARTRAHAVPAQKVEVVAQGKGTKKEPFFGMGCYAYAKAHAKATGKKAYYTSKNSKVVAV